MNALLFWQWRCAQRDRERLFHPEALYRLISEISLPVTRPSVNLTLSDRSDNGA